MSIYSILSQIKPPEDLDKAIEALGTAWRRQVKADTEKNGSSQLGTFSRHNEDLSQFEMDFVLDWVGEERNKIAAMIAPSVSSVKATVQTSSPEDSSKTDALEKSLRKKIEVELKANMSNDMLNIKAQAQAAAKTEFDKKLTEEVGKILAKAKEDAALKEEEITQKATDFYTQQLAAKENQMAADQRAALAEQRATLTEAKGSETLSKIEEARNQSADSIEILNKKVLALQEDNAAIKLAATEQQQKQENTFTASLKELTTKHNTERKVDKQLIKELTTQIEGLTAEKRFFGLNENAVVNIVSNIFAAISMINMLQQYGVLAAIILILSFRVGVKLLGKKHANYSAWGGFFGIAVIEFIYFALHTTFFKDLLEHKTHLPFDMTYTQTANWLAAIISGASLFVAIMTRFDAIDNAEKERVEAIDKQLFNPQSNTDTDDEPDEITE